MATANEALLDAETAHAIGMQRYANGVVRRMIALLNRIDADLFIELTKQLEKAPDSFSVRRIDALLKSVRQLNEEAYRQLELELNDELKDLVKYEGGYQKQLFEAQLPVVVTVASIAPEQVYTAALARPFQGRLLKEWMDGLEVDKAVRVRDAVRMGFSEGQTIDQIVRRLRGTKARGYEDGIIEITRRNAETVVRTAVSHMAGFTRDRFYQQNNDLIKGIKWVSTLDSRTSDACIIRDGKMYGLDHKPQGHAIPWGGGPGALHFNCRSSSVPVLKSWRDMGIDEDEIDAGTRASLDGQVPADVTFGEWLKKQPAEVQDDVLGTTRGKMLRNGKTTVDRFFNDKGKFLSLDELRQRDARLFQSA
jgi:SPP1 gp7 family putative phage head morphogenesis protein